MRFGSLQHIPARAASNEGAAFRSIPLRRWFALAVLAAIASAVMSRLNFLPTRQPACATAAGTGHSSNRSPECATYQTHTVRFRTAWPNRHRSGGAHGILRPSQRVLCAGPAAFLPDQPTCRFSIACCRCFSRRTRRFLLLNLHLSAKSKAFAAAPGRSRTQLRLSMFLRSRTAMGFSSSRFLRRVREINRGARRSGSRHL